MENAKLVKALCGGVWRPVGKLIFERGRPVFEQRIDPGDVLQIFGAAGIDLRYQPELPKETLIRHRVGDRVYEIGLSALLAHPKTLVRQIGPLHPKRAYLSYRFWIDRTPGRCLGRLFDENGKAVATS